MLVAAGRVEPTVADGESGVAEPVGAMLAGAEAELQAAAGIAVENAGENAAMGIVAGETDEGRAAIYFAAAVGCEEETAAYSETGLAPAAG